MRLAELSTESFGSKSVVVPMVMMQYLQLSVLVLLQKSLFLVEQ
jgi:hypothetical protein